MFEYSCSATHLANWVFSQVANQTGAVFPKRKGWTFYINTFYPAGSDRSMLMVMASNNSECIVFLPVDDKIDAIQIKSSIKANVLNSLRREFKQVSYQTIFITCERQQERVCRIFDKKEIKSPLLVLYSEKVGFVRGNFDNPRLEFRLSQHDYDPDLIPGFLHDSRLENLENIQKLLYYQDFFHIMNGRWLNGEKRVPLRQVVTQSVPCWGQLRRIDQKRILQQVSADLIAVFDQVFQGQIVVEIYRKKASSQPEEIISLPDPPTSRKEITAWNKKQKQALESLTESRRPLSIEELELFIN